MKFLLLSAVLLLPSAAFAQSPVSQDACYQAYSDTADALARAGYESYDERARQDRWVHAFNDAAEFLIRPARYAELAHTLCTPDQIALLARVRDQANVRSARLAAEEQKRKIAQIIAAAIAAQKEIQP